LHNKIYIAEDAFSEKGNRDFAGSEKIRYLEKAERNATCCRLWAIPGRMDTQKVWNELSLQQAAGHHVDSLYAPMKLNAAKFEFIPRCKQRGIRT
jgi:hypothetical protein